MTVYQNNNIIFVCSRFTQGYSWVSWRWCWRWGPGLASGPSAGASLAMGAGVGIRTRCRCLASGRVVRTTSSMRDCVEYNVILIRLRVPLKVNTILYYQYSAVNRRWRDAVRSLSSRLTFSGGVMLALLAPETLCRVRLAAAPIGADLRV